MTRVLEGLLGPFERKRPIDVERRLGRLIREDLLHRADPVSDRGQPSETDSVRVVKAR